ncbi:hypothetical protein F2Q68_00034607 [Brassica cretica]|uniref:C3H1-type domain-containing protein n=2 Tax=Brassica cretica TaxID=69181 RepID=A0ABQ7E7Z8_BRACR|nr:hypothetical protein F2Q68_00034607 [Brassica cretica]KAF3593323.1 hypothetical protein DY000_02022458 [Brassica cretica]
MGDATSLGPIPTSPAEVPACVASHLSFRERLVRRQAEKELVQAGRRPGSWDRGRGSERRKNSCRLGHSRCSSSTCRIVHDTDPCRG